MKSIKERILDRFFPIKTVVRVIAGQFSMPEGVSAILTEDKEIIFAPANLSVFADLCVGVSLKDLRLTVMQNGMHLYDMKRGEEIKLNWREASLLRAATLDWMQLDGIGSQFRVAPNYGQEAAA